MTEEFLVLNVEEYINEFLSQKFENDEECNQFDFEIKVHKGHPSIDNKLDYSMPRETIDICIVSGYGIWSNVLNSLLIDLQNIIVNRESSLIFCDFSIEEEYSIFLVKDINKNSKCLIDKLYVKNLIFDRNFKYGNFLMDYQKINHRSAEGYRNHVEHLMKKMPRTVEDDAEFEGNYYKLLGFA